MYISDHFVPLWKKKRTFKKHSDSRFWAILCNFTENKDPEEKMEAYILIVLHSDMYYYPVLCIILNTCFTRAKYAVFKLFSCVHTVIMNVLK